MSPGGRGPGGSGRRGGFSEGGRANTTGAEAEQRRPSIVDVAKRAGVAASSVSRVLSDRPGVSPAMRTRVLEAVSMLGYEPDLPAQSLRRGITMTIGFVIGDISNPLLAEIAYGAELTLQEAGYSMLLMNSGGDARLDAAHIRVLRQRRVDGLLLSLATEANRDTLAELARNRAPLVLVDRDPSRLPGSSAVLSDHAQGTTDAVEHLISQGHKQIALINGDPHLRPARERAAALRRACRRDLGISPVVRSGPFNAQHGEATTKELLAAEDRPTALICGGNQILPGVLRALREAGLRVPDDISLVTCDDVALAEFLQPALSTISRDPVEMGSVAADLVLRRLRAAQPSFVVLPTTFRSAQSTASPPAGAWRA